MDDKVLQIHDFLLNLPLDLQEEYDELLDEWFASQETFSEIVSHSASDTLKSHFTSLGLSDREIETGLEHILQISLL